MLANEQVIDGKGWRSGVGVERKKLSQWFFNIKKFSQNLLDELKKLENWPEKVKLMQKNWIGKSYGCEINFQIKKVNLIKLKFLPQGQIQYLVHPLLRFRLTIQLQKILKEIKIFFRLNQNVQKWEQPKKR